MRVAIAVVMLAALAGRAEALTLVCPSGSEQRGARCVVRNPVERMTFEAMYVAHKAGRVESELTVKPSAHDLARRQGDALSRRHAEIKAFDGGCPVDAAAGQGGLDPNDVGRRYGALILLLTPPAAFLGLLSLQHRRHRRQASR